ncbi:MAG TPA: M28 family peptidase [Gemmatimonadaceae bacterium]|nr:M28 family peptidase [Gemmatimonadaceae bacterium]
MPELGELAVSHVRRLARQPRHTCTPEAADARQYCVYTLRSLGYRVEECPFDYSAAVGAYGTPAGGLAVLLVIAAGWVSALGGKRVLALVILLAGIVFIAVGGRWLARHGILALPLMRRRGVNLEARRDQEDPSVWLVAHLDSKSQPVSLVVRATGIIVLLTSWIAAVVAAWSGRSASTWSVIMVAAFIGALPVLLSVVGKASPGAVDNASGVATVLAATAALPPDVPVGVLITDAEEFGLAGARAWCAGRAPAIALNCDGVDDTGRLTVMWTRPRPRWIQEAFSATKGLRVIPLLPGVLADSLAFSDAGWEAVTLSRGTLRTLRRIHTRRDSLETLRGSGIAGAALALASAAVILTEHG